MVRHSERADNAGQEEKSLIENEMDPHMTKRGGEMAQVTGKHLKEWLAEEKFELVVIESSPWLRCLQTASIIAKEIGIEQIRCNFMYGEWVSEKYYSEQPVGKLTIQTQPLDEVRQKYLNDIKIEVIKPGQPLFVWEQNMIHQYPEDQSRVFNRSIACTKSFAGLYR